MKEKEAGSHHPDRDTPFHHIEAQQEAFAAAGDPIISVDTTKKEWIGDFNNAGQTWCPRPIEVNGHDFPSDALGRAVPMGSPMCSAMWVPSMLEPRRIRQSLPSWRVDPGGRTSGARLTPRPGNS